MEILAFRKARIQRNPSRAYGPEMICVKKLSMSCHGEREGHNAQSSHLTEKPDKKVPVHT